MQPETAREAIELKPVELKPARPARFMIGIRLRGALLAIPCAGILLLAHSLTPRKSGYGTHEELGMPACAFLQRTGYPCPSCGLTTSFASLAHGDVRAGFRAQPGGLVLFAGVVVVGVAALGELACGRDLLRRLHPGPIWAFVIIAGVLGGWAFKIVHGLSAGTLPVH